MKQKIGHWLPIVVVLQFGVLAGSAQGYLFTGAETTVTLNPGSYDILAYGAAGGNGSGNGGGLGAEMEGQFNFATAVNLTILVGGVGGVGGGWGGGGGGGDQGGGGGGGYSGGGGSSNGGGGGGGSFINSSATLILTELAGVRSGNGEIDIVPTPEPSTFGLFGVGIAIFAALRWRKLGTAECFSLKSKPVKYG